MAKSRSLFVCQQCSYESHRWLGKCPECGEWNSFVETIIKNTSSAGRSSKASRAGKVTAEPILLSSVKSSATKRTSTKISELDRVLGGGIVPGQVILVAGEPGIGKSTILLQLADQLTANGIPTTAKSKKAVDSRQSTVVYVSGEESVNQIAIRGTRLGIRNKSIQIMENTDVDSIVDEVSRVPRVSSVSRAKKSRDTRGTFDTPDTLLIIDSIQTMQTSDLSGMAGSVGQVRECTYRLVRLAKSRNISIFIVGHVTKQGAVAGPAVLAHLVDTVLWFEGDKTTSLRLLRAVKNRFGPTDEVGIFSMEDKGLISQTSPEKIFLSKLRKQVAGSVTSCIVQGTRPVLVEIQSLVVPSKLAFPKRIAQGFDSKRLELLIAVLIRRCGLPLYEYDVFVNLAGGISVRNDPSVDLAVCLSIASSFYDKPVAKGSVAIGEVGLLGDIREVTMQEKRVKESRRLGYRKIISSKESKYLLQAIKIHIK